MKIAYILYPEVIVSNRSNGIRSQAETWAKLLQAEGHEVVLINNWDDYNWTDFDIIHLFGGGTWVNRIAMRLSKYNPRIIWSPIIDPQINTGSYNKTRINRLIQKITKNHYEWRFSGIIQSKTFIQKYLVRSNFEKDYITKALGVPKGKVCVVPLSYSFACKTYKPLEKESFCLHISSIYQERKNVVRLINAAKKYNFKLVLAGNCGTQEQFYPIQTAIAGNRNISVLGFVSEEQKIELYKKAKVFALPSLSEGVGIVALDAAYYGCEIAITNIPGPKEYYQGQCVEINPYDIDSIGQSIIKLLKGDMGFQPKLKEFISNTYSDKSIGTELINAYLTVLS